MTDDATTPNKNDVETTGKDGMIQLEVKAVVEGTAKVIAVLTCIDTLAGRRGALHLADNARSLFARDAEGSPPCKGLAFEGDTALIDAQKAVTK
jgi:hypothetical protein